MKITTKSKYLKDSKTYTSVSSQATNGALKQVTNILEDNNSFKYSIDDGATYKSVSGGGGGDIPDGSITNSKLASGAVTKDKINGLLANISELNYMQGVTANVQTQISNIRNGTTPVESAISANSANTANSSVNAYTAVSAGTVTGTIASGVTATTQVSTDNSTKVATTAFVQSVASNIGTSTAPVARAVLADTATYATSAGTAGSAETAGTANSATTAGSATSATNLTGTIASGVTATTQVSTDNSTKVATTAFVQSVVGDINTLLIALDSGTGV